jgi:hypothetical protein
MFKIIVTALIVVVAAILIMAATRPDTFRVERSIRVSAPPEKIFHYVNDFHQWGVCSGTQVTGSMDGDGVVFQHGAAHRRRLRDGAGQSEGRE